MRTRTEVVLALAAFAALLATVGLATGHGPTPLAPDPRPSTFLAGPEGTEALFDALHRLGIGVRRFRDRPTRLVLPDTGAGMLVILDPDPGHPLSAPDIATLFRLAAHTDLLLAGAGANPLMRCFGYEAKENRFDSVGIAGLDPPAPRTDGVLAATHQVVVVDTSRVADFAPVRCKVPAIASSATLLTSRRGPVALRLTRRDNGHVVYLFADAGIFRNATLRGTSAGPFALGLFAGEPAVIFDEYHHGFSRAGSLPDAALAWSRASPWGWAIWQLAAVGALALLFGAIRFGPAVPAISRRRRSSLEHVHALAAALSAAHGHDQAIAALVRGLRRRLSPPSLGMRTDWRVWLRQLVARDRSPERREALDTLDALSAPGQPAMSVLRAAGAVEELWQNLKP